MMTCPKCGCTDSVRCYRVDSDEEYAFISRRRKCIACNHKFSTVEEPVEKPKPKPKPRAQPKPRPKERMQKIQEQTKKKLEEKGYLTSSIG